ncbi:MAG TPA: aminotransferase class V-fold PLP-dependent enzyme, partial [Alphaproteobacteria bacterium]|nr:aminotransferase class V-fold PLP-dependent enzyme [Alphaproteobacteria bacterium]
MTIDRSQGRHLRGTQSAEKLSNSTITGNRALQIEEPLIFEQGAPGRTGVDLPVPDESLDRLGGLKRDRPIGLPGLSEPEVVRHYTRLSRNNYAIDLGFYPLGSCTMKHNPRLNERLARLPGLADIHPLQPESTVQGGLAVIEQVSNWLKVLTGFPAVAMSPAAGAQGELCGLMTIRTCLMARGDPRAVVLIPDSAHGTNPATATMCGYRTESIPSDTRGRVDLNALSARLGPDIAALMLTNPNTCGVFENEIIKIAAAVHEVGAFLYCDGANFNALVGKVRPV